jgi:hypothetical protein
VISCGLVGGASRGRPRGRAKLAAVSTTSIGQAEKRTVSEAGKLTAREVQVAQLKLEISNRTQLHAALEAAGAMRD